MSQKNRSKSPGMVPAPVPIQELCAVLKGRVIVPGDADYDNARALFYGGFDYRPAAIARVADEADVSTVISLARDARLELAIRSGGHSLVGHSVSDGGIVLDLSEMRALHVDVEGRTAWAQTGLTSGEYTEVTATHGLATGFGDTGSVGIGGITLGGGVGYLVRKHGLTIDNLLAADVVTAGGERLHVDAETHPDLFWAIRGGGGNFGVATRFQFRLHPVDTIVGGMLILPATPDVIASFVAEADAAPDELSTIVNVMPAPPMPMVPEEQHGRLVVMALLVYAGAVDEGERVIAPFRSLATPIVDMVKSMPYVALTLLDRHADKLDRVVISGVTAAPMPNRALLPVQLGLMTPLMKRRWFVDMQARSLRLPPVMQSAFADNLLAMSKQAYRRIWEEAAHFRVPSSLRHVNTPTLITAGSRESRIITQAVRTISEFMPNAQGRLAPGAGHGWNVEAPNLFNAMVRAWIMGARLPDRLQAAHSGARTSR